MVKILISLIAAIVIAVGVFFGFQFYTQHRIASELDAAFEQIRATGGKASHGKISFDLLSRTVKITDLAAQSAAQPPVGVKIATLTASGLSQPDAARFSADTIEATAATTVTLTTKDPIGNFEANMAFMYVLPKHIWEDVAA